AGDHRPGHGLCPGAERAAAPVRPLYHRADGGALPRPGREHHQRGGGRTGGRHLRPVRQDRPAGGDHGQDRLRAGGCAATRKVRKQKMKQWMKKSLAACLALVMCLTLAACGGKEGETPAEESVNVRVAALKGPTAMGMVKLMSDYAPVEEALEDKENVVTAGGGNTYEFTLAASADEVSPKLMQGELDIACVPANLASVLYNRTDGGIVTLAVNTLGVLYIVENGNSVQSMADLAGRTIVASGKGSTPEYALRYLLTE
ncbi:Haloacid dehalogenase, partial [Dysosmobacter welbionis]